MKTHPFRNRVAAALACRPAGRVLLHLITALRHPSHWRWHAAHIPTAI